MFLQIHTRHYGDVTILDARGELSRGSSDDLLAIIRKLTAAGSRQIVLNLQDIAYFSNAAVEPLVAAAREVARLGGEIKLAGFRLSPDDVLTIARLYAVFDIADDDATAVCNFAMPSSGQTALFLG